MSNLAIDGGKSYRKTPFPERTPYGEEEVALVTEAIRSQNLFGLGGPKVSALEAEFARLYGAKHAVIRIASRSLPTSMTATTWTGRMSSAR